MDDETIQHSVDQIKSYGLFKSESPLKQISELLTMKLNYIDTFVKLAANKGDSLTANPLNGKYAEYSTLLAIGEAGLYNESATAMPILTEGKNFLFIAFPTKFSSEIVPVISQNKAVIANEFKKFESRIDRLIKILTRQNYDLGEIGKFAGNFLGGIYNAIQ